MKQLFLSLIALGLVSPAFAAEAPIPSGESDAVLSQEQVPNPADTMSAKELENAADMPKGNEHETATGSSHAAEIVHQDWTFDGMFGTYDRAALQRGLKVYREVCAACHSLKRVYFRNLEGVGYDEGQIKNIASQYTVNDGPNDEGEMFDRPGLPSDHFVSPYPNDKAAQALNGGALPPDLSLITKARHHGPDYVYGILTGFDAPPAGAEVPEGKHWNKQFPGHIISMAPPLQDGQVAYEDNAPQTLEQYSHDVVQFLTWASDPDMEERKRTGIKVLIFLAVFAGLMYAVKRKIWANLH